MSTVDELRAAIFAADDSPIEQHEVPEWGVTLGLKPISAEQRLDLIDKYSSGDSNGEVTNVQNAKRMYPELIALIVVNPDTGEPLFTEADYDRLMKRNGKVIERLANTCLQHSGLAPESVPTTSDDS